MTDGSMASICLLESMRDQTGIIIDFIFRGVSQATEATTRLSPSQLLGKRFRGDLQVVAGNQQFAQLVG